MPTVEIEVDRSHLCMAVIGSGRNIDGDYTVRRCRRHAENQISSHSWVDGQWTEQGDYVCDDHYIANCYHCGDRGESDETSRWIYNRIGEHVCSSCAEDFHACTVCDHVLHADDIYYDNNDDAMCGSCYEERDEEEPEINTNIVHGYNYKPFTSYFVDVENDIIKTKRNIRNYVNDYEYEKFNRIKVFSPKIREFSLRDFITIEESYLSEEGVKDRYEKCMEDLSSKGTTAKINSADFFHYSPNMFLGLELEMEVPPDSYDETVNYLHDYYGEGKHNNILYLKQDGSLTDYGVEMCFHPMTLFAFKKFVPRKLFSDLRDAGCRSWNAPSSCGMHVHMSRSGFENQSHIFKFTHFINNNRNNNFNVAGRDNPSWAQYPSGDERGNTMKVIKGEMSPPGRYMAVNLVPTHTVEVRIFKGSLKYERVMAALEYVSAIAEYSKDITIRNIYEGNAYDWRPFREFVASNLATYSNLAGYLKINNQINEKETVA